MTLDGCILRTLIQEQDSRRLKLYVIGEERLIISAFGSQRPLEKRRCRRVKCCQKNCRNNSRVCIEALEIPKISGELLLPPHDHGTRLMQEQGLKLADAVPHGYKHGVGTELLTVADY
ncbi:hypothetical protein MRX96_016725 [Rhipicephalus microplus]